MDDWFIDLIKKYEGFRSKAYYDVDHWSIGYGSDTMPDGSPVKQTSTITEKEAAKLIPAYIKKKETLIKKYIPKYDSLPTQVKYALIDHLYRGGEGSFQKSPKFIDAINNGFADGKLTMEEAKAIIKELDLDKASKGIKDRKERRAAMLMGVYNPEHNNSVYSEQSPYLQFDKDFFNPASMWGQVALNLNRGQDFIVRMKDPKRESLDLGNGKVGTHKLSYATTDAGYDIVFPNIQTTKSWLLGKSHLVDFTGKDPLKHAIQNGDTIHVPVGFGEPFTTQYKQYYPGYNKHGGTLNYLNYFKPGGLFSTLDEYVEKAEPYAAGLALTGSAVGLGTALTGVGAPLGGTIALLSNIPSTAIDIYQTARDAYKVSQGETENIPSLGWNAAETALDIGGIKAFKYLKGISADRKFAKELANRIAAEKAKREGQKQLLTKKGMTDTEAIAYIADKAANAATNSADMVQRKKDLKKEADKKAVFWNYGTSFIPNTVDIVYPILPDGSYLLPEVNITAKQK